MKNEKERLYQELDKLITENDKEGVVANYKAFSEIMEKTAFARRDVIYNGFKYKYDADTGNIVAEDIRVATITIHNSRNTPKAKIRFSDKVVKVFNRSRERELFYKNGDDPIVLNIPIAYLRSNFEGIMYVDESDPSPKKLEAENVLYSADSIQTFYSIDGGRTYFICFTKAKVNNLWNHDCPDIYRYDTNTTAHYNDWGLCFTLWECSLIEWYNSTVYLDDSITEEEIGMITKGREDLYAARKIIKAYERISHEVTEEEKSAVISEVTNKVKMIQAVIDENRSQIIDSVFEQMGGKEALDSEMKLRWIHHKESGYGLDCGFCYYNFANEDFNEMAKTAAHYGSDQVNSQGSLSLHTPINVQSTTVQRYEASAISMLVNKTDLPKIKYYTVLD